jgi:hypothetical protein
LTWWFRIGCPIFGIVCLVPLVWAQTRKDKIPNFLSKIALRYFERDGFCFAIVPKTAGGNCWMQIYFQNRYDQPCSAQILLRTSSGLFSGKPDLSDLTLGLSCDPAAFGCSTIPWSVPENLQGKAVSLSLYASVKYPNGRGKLLRYKDGMRVGSVGTDVWREGLQIAGALGGAIVVSRPARIKFTLPSGVSASRQETVSAETKTIWKLGDAIA